MGESLGFVVITFNQASHMPGLNPGADLYYEMDDARNALEWERRETAKTGRREWHVLAEVFPLEED